MKFAKKALSSKYLISFLEEEKRDLFHSFLIATKELKISDDVSIKKGIDFFKPGQALTVKS